MGETAEAAQPPTRVGATTTGKEEDIDVGLTYFGKRYLSPYLNRWISADPLAVHGLGADLNLYAYVSGRALQAVDPVGLTPDNKVQIEQALFEQTNGQYGANHAQAATDPAPTGSAGSGGTSGSSQTVSSGFGGGRGSGNSGGAPGFDPEGVAGLDVAASTIPGVGEAMDAEAVLDPDTDAFQRWMCIGSLGLSAVTLGTSPNAAAFFRSADKLGDAASEGRRLTLFHGTSETRAAGLELHGPDLSKGSATSDFGRGFYLTTDPKRAAAWAEKRFGDQGVVMQYSLDLDQVGNLRTFSAEDDALETLVDFHRQKAGPTPAHGFDAVTGPMLKNPKSYLKKGPVWFGSQFSVHTERGVNALTLQGRLPL